MAAQQPLKFDLFSIGDRLRKKGAAAALASTTPEVDAVAAAAGDNTTKYAAEQDAAARSSAYDFGEVSVSANDADLLGRSAAGTRRRGAASRALLG